MKSCGLGEIVAERQLELIDVDGLVTPCKVSVGAPIPDDNGDWACPYKVEAGSETSQFRMHGIDSMQALLLTLKTLDGEISRTADKFGARVSYLDGSHVSVFNP